MAAALPGFAFHAFANLWDQQPELAVGLYAVGAVAVAVPHYIPTFEQAKLWCQKSRQSTKPVAASTPLATNPPGTVISISSRHRRPSVIVITRSASTPLPSEAIVTAEDHVEAEVLNSSVSSNPAHATSDSPAIHSVSSREKSTFQAGPASSAAIDTSPEVFNEVPKAVPVETSNTHSEHTEPTSSTKVSVLSAESAPSLLRRSIRSASTHASAAPNRSSESEDESVSNAVDADSSASNTEASNCTNVASAVSPSALPHSVTSYGNTTLGDPLVSNKSMDQNASVVSSDATSTVVATAVQKLSRTLFDVIADKLPATPTLYKKTETPTDNNKRREPSPRTALSQLPFEHYFSKTLEGSSWLGEQHPAFTTLVEQSPSPLPATFGRITGVETQKPSKESSMAQRGDRKPTASSYYNNFISWLDVVLILVPSILIAISIDLAGDDPLDQDLYATLVATSCTVVVGCLPYLDFRWPTLRYSFLALYRHSLDFMSSSMICFIEIFHRWQETLSGVIGKQHENYVIADRAPYAVFIGSGFAVLFFITSRMITRLLQRADLTQWQANVLRLYIGCGGLLVTLAVIWLSDYVQDFVLVFATTGITYLLQSYHGKVMNSTYCMVYRTCRLIKEAMWPYVAVHVAVTTAFYLVTHPHQIIECFTSTNGPVSSPFRHCAILVKYGVFSIAVLIMHTSIVPRGLRVIRAWVGENFNLVTRNMVVDTYKYIYMVLDNSNLTDRLPNVQWHPKLRGYRFWRSLFTIIDSAGQVSEVLAEWAGPALKASTMLIMALVVMRGLIPLNRVLFEQTWNTIQLLAVQSSILATHIVQETKLLTATIAPYSQAWSVEPLMRVVFDSLSNASTMISATLAKLSTKPLTAMSAPFFQAWFVEPLMRIVFGFLSNASTMISAALAKLSTNLEYLYHLYVRPVAVYIGMICHSNWCQGPAWWWILRAIAIILATVLCTAGWVVAARAYPEYKVRSCLSFAASFVVVYILGTFGVLHCTQDYPIILASVICILLYIRPETQIPAHVAPSDEAPGDEGPSANELFPDEILVDVEPTVRALPSPSVNLTGHAPGSVALPLPSERWWQPTIDFFCGKNAARAAKERAIREARAAADQENANFQSCVERMRLDRSSSPVDDEYLQRVRDLTPQTNTTQPLSNEGEIPTATRGWDTTQPFRPMYMYTEREYQAALRGEVDTKVTPEATLGPPAETDPASLAHESTATVTADSSTFTPAPSSAITSVPSFLFASAAPAAPASLATVVPLAPSFQVRAGSLHLATTFDSLSVSAPTTTPAVAHEPTFSTTGASAELDAPDAISIITTSSPNSEPQPEFSHEANTPIATTNTLVGSDRTPAHTFASAPVTRLAELGVPAINPGSEQIPSNLSKPSVSAPDVQNAEPSLGHNELLNEDELADELENLAGDDGSDFVENVQADSQEQDKLHNEGDSNEEEDEEFSSCSDETGLDDGTFDRELVDEPEELDGEALVIAKQLREEMDSGARRDDFATPVQAAFGKTPPLADDRHGNEQTGKKAEEQDGTTPMDVDSGGLPSRDGNDYDDEDGSGVDTPMDGVQEDDANMLEQEASLGTSGDDVTMRGTSDEGVPGRNERTGEGDEGGDAGSSEDRPASYDSFRGGGAIDPDRPTTLTNPLRWMGDMEARSSSGEDSDGEADPIRHANNGSQTANKRAGSENTKDEDESDDSGDHRGPDARRQASAVGVTTSTASSADGSEAVTATGNTTTKHNVEDGEMTDVSVPGGTETGAAGHKASAPLRFNADELWEAIRAVQNTDTQQHVDFTTPRGLEGGQDSITDDEDDRNSVHADAAGRLSFSDVPRSLTTQASPIDSSRTHSPVSNVNSRDADENGSPSQQIGGRSSEENIAAAIEAEGCTPDYSIGRYATSKSASNPALRVNYSDSESNLSDPPDSIDLDTTGANLLTEEMDAKVPVLKKGGEELIDNSELVSEDDHPSSKEMKVSTLVPASDVAASRQERSGDSMESPTRSALMFSPPTSAPQRTQKQRYSGPVSFNLRNKAGDASKISSPA